VFRLLTTSDKQRREGPRSRAFSIIIAAWGPACRQSERSGRRQQIDPQPRHEGYLVATIVTIGTTVAEFRSALRGFLRQSELVARWSGLTLQRYLLLLMIKGAPDQSEQTTVTGLSRKLQLAKSTVIELGRPSRARAFRCRWPRGAAAVDSGRRPPAPRVPNDAGDRAPSAARGGRITGELSSASARKPRGQLRAAGTARQPLVIGAVPRRRGGLRGRG
jgi:hypothetical protein